MEKPNSGYFDLSAVFNIEQNYITDLSNSYSVGENSAATVATYVLNLQNQMKGLANKFSSANTSGQAVLDQQNAMMNILNEEQQRLDEKKGLIDEAAVQNERIALLNTTYQKQYGQYTKMMIVLIIGLAIHIILRIISNMFSQAPDGLIILLHIVNIVVCLILITIIYSTLMTRSQIDYDELNLPPPNTTGSGSGPATTPDSGNAFGICAEQYCCGTGTIWNPSLGVCVTPATTPVTAPMVAPSAMPVPTPMAAPVTAPSATPSSVESFLTIKYFDHENPLLPLPRVLQQQGSLYMNTPFEYSNYSKI